MESVNADYLGKHKKFRADSKKLATLFLIAAFIVAVIVFWWLKLVGITVTGEAFCGLEEHTHGDECYVSELVCGFDVFEHLLLMCVARFGGVHPDVRAVDAEVREGEVLAVKFGADLSDESVVEGRKESGPDVGAVDAVAVAEHVQVVEHVAFSFSEESVERVGGDGGFDVRHREFLSYVEKFSGIFRSYSRRIVFIIWDNDENYKGFFKNIHKIMKIGLDYSIYMHYIRPVI